MGSRGDATVIYWNDKERGYAVAPGEITKGLTMSCTICKHSVAWSWARVHATWSAGLYTRDIAASLRCSQCGEPA
jgi:hypothetical protein